MVAAAECLLQYIIEVYAVDKVHSMLSVGKAQLGRSAGGLQRCFPIEFRRVILCESVNSVPGGWQVGLWLWVIYL